MISHQHSGMCDEDPEAGPGPSTARFYSRSDTAPHISETRNSFSTSPDDEHPKTVYSDEEFIATAITRPTPNDDHEIPHVQPVEEELAAHVAMFIPSHSSSELDAQSAQQYSKITGERRRNFPWREELTSDGLYKSYSYPEGGFEIMQPSAQPARRRAISLDTFDGSAANPQWPGNVPAVRVHQPPYPPPERMATPPGLPSFGTPEAMATSAQFLQGPTSDPSSRRREHSPSDAIRRLFGLHPPAHPTPPSSPSPSNSATAAVQSARGIGRAPDGTMVLGRFGYRQSGHGMNLAQGLGDHTFHAENTPAVTAEPSPIESRRSSDGTATETASFKSTLSRPKRYARLFRPSIADLFASYSPEPGSSPSPERAMTPPRRNPARLLQAGQQRQPAGRDGSPLRSSQSRENSPLPNSFQRHTVIDQTIQEEEIETETGPQTNTANHVLFRIPIHFPLCCCLRSQVAHQVSDEVPLENIGSRDSYVTAQSQSSPIRAQSPRRQNNHPPVQTETHAWTPVYDFIRRGTTALSQYIS